ncbi:pyridoxal-phosphate dependent enzyme [Sphingobacterium daejeonense]|uniref:pyridoxal-phosphate dependent enzyme n=1 Tax=Sphingobacterium daejeonense TaxID=371142 RepID=UPI0010C47B83|nr:pyridoxal-phosphate dependent enzyme [Sphingobacterium daejeonense]VTP98737.1 D-cysteine desulfhydrase [Sphingobacterium daejeonense]
MKEVNRFDSHLLVSGINRLKLLSFPSPLLYLQGLSNELETPIYIKRDDLTELGCGGNKLRKLEYLLADAKQYEANRIITIGARQSNHARLTAVTAKMMGFDVDLVLKNSVPLDTESYQLNGNLVLDNIVDANIHEIAK